MSILTILWRFLVKLYQEIQPDRETARLLLIFMPLVALFFGIIISSRVTNLVYHFATGIYSTFRDLIWGFIDIFSSMIDFSFMNYFF